MALVSNSSREILAETLKYRPWASYFEHRFAVDDVENPKPAPDLYLLAANKLNVGIQQALVLEDSLTGVKAAVSAGATCVAVPDHIEAAFYELTPHVFSNLNAFLEHLG